MAHGMSTRRDGSPLTVHLFVPGPGDSGLRALFAALPCDPACQAGLFGYVHPGRNCHRLAGVITGPEEVPVFQ